MKTVLFKEVNGYKIIKGFSKLTIDPVATKKNIANLYKDTEHGKRFAILTHQLKVLNEAITSINPRIPGIQNDIEISLKNLGLSQKEIDQVIIYQNEQKEIIRELNELLVSKREKEKQLIKENPVYFEPTDCEIIKTDSEIEILKSIKIEENQEIDVDGNIIPNFTGIDFWVKNDQWEKVSYDFGEEKAVDAKNYSDLTDEEKQEIIEQFETERISALNQIDKENERQKLVDQLATQAALKRSGLEIQGESPEDAFFQSQQWYNEELIKIEERYG